MRLARQACALASAFVLAAIAPSVALGFTVDPESHTAEEIRARYEQLEPAYSGTPYASVPAWAAPYAPGALREEFLADGIDALNWYRYLAGLPDDVALDATRNADSQHGAVLLRASTFSHTPPKPADMDDAFYARGLASTSSSNIGWGYTDLESFQRACMRDSDAGNISRVGHRRWILNPRMARTGMGYADARMTTYAFDQSRADAVDYEFISWPPAGLMPADVFGGSNVPWSVTLNPNLYTFDAPLANSNVTMTRASDGRTWTFDGSDANVNGEYFNFDTGGYGVSNCFIFRPDPSSVAYAAGDSFTVTIEGGIRRKADGAPATLSFQTTFMSLAEDPPPDPDPEPDPETGGNVVRLWGTSRFSTAVAIAREAYDPAGDRSWPGVSHVVIASGDDRAAADPLAASGLCWAYDAPLLLVGATQTPAEVTAALDEIADANGHVTVHVVGGEVSVPSARIAELRAAVGVGRIDVERLVSGGSRYDLAAAVAREMREVAGETPDVVLVANGADPAKFFDALALSPIAAAKGFPVLLVSATNVPAATSRALADSGAFEVVVGGGENTVSEAVYRAVGGTRRWSGRTRYATALAVANGAIEQGWLGCGSPGVAAKLPDALAGGCALGKLGGVLTLTDGAALTDSTGAWFGARAADVETCYVFGGPASVCADVVGSLAECLY